MLQVKNLTITHRKDLTTLVEGLSFTLAPGDRAAVIGEEAVTIEDVYEPYLMQIGFIQRTPRGRVVLPAAYAHLGIEYMGQMTLG